MAKDTKKEEGLEEEIAQLRDLLGKAANKVGSNDGLENLLPVLDSVGRAAPQLAKLIQAQRQLEGAGDDPMEILRQALAELEEEWPELKECKEGLRNGGDERPRRGELQFTPAECEKAAGQEEKAVMVSGLKSR